MKTVKKILVPVDFSECSRQAFSYALDMARASGAKLYLLHVLDSDLIASVSAYGVREDDLRRRMEEYARRSFEEMVGERTEGVDILRLVEEGIPFLHILRKAKDIEVDMIIMGSSGTSSPLQRILFGSTVEKVLKGAHVPVLCVPLPEVIEQEGGLGEG